MDKAVVIINAGYLMRLKSVFPNKVVMEVEVIELFLTTKKE